MNTKTKNDIDAGSRMHVLDWLEAPSFLSDLRAMVAPQGFVVKDGAAWQPKGRHDRGESVLVGIKERFLTPAQKETLKKWWLVHSRGAKLPTWDLVVTAEDPSGTPALILVEAKAHLTELKADGKPEPVRNLPDEQLRSDENHDRIGAAIDEACAALRATIPTLSIGRDIAYQFSNRIAFAWKLAFMGIPVVLIYLGFTGDTGIHPVGYLKSDEHWRKAVQDYTRNQFPSDQLEREIACGPASFWLTIRSLPCRRSSPALEKRRPLP